MDGVPQFLSAILADISTSFNFLNIDMNAKHGTMGHVSKYRSKLIFVKNIVQILSNNLLIGDRIQEKRYWKTST